MILEETLGIRPLRLRRTSAVVLHTTTKQAMLKLTVSFCIAVNDTPAPLSPARVCLAAVTAYLGTNQHPLANNATVRCLVRMSANMMSALLTNPTLDLPLSNSRAIYHWSQTG